MSPIRFSRRRALRALGAAAASMLGATAARGQPRVTTRAIGRGADALPIVGLGSWITFNVGNDGVARDRCADVMRHFFDAGGRLIDSSPMYGSSQEVIGYGLARSGRPASLFAADKVWIAGGSRGPAQIEESRRRWNVERFDLLQVHNLLSWQAHLETLFAMKSQGRVRYVGVTTSEGRRHDDVERIMRSQPIDFVQLTYNPVDREAEARLLPLALERGIGVIVNRPFRAGELTRRLDGRSLPGFAADIGCTCWAQLILKFVGAHPAVTCAIPATTRVDHVVENMAAARGAFPDAPMRERIAAAIRG